MTYIFPQFKVKIVDPTVTVQSVTDNLQEKTCTVDIILTTDTAKFGVNLQGFTYETTWEDADIYEWVQVELQKYEV